MIYFTFTPFTECVGGQEEHVNFEAHLSKIVGVGLIPVRLGCRTSWEV